MTKHDFKIILQQLCNLKFMAFRDNDFVLINNYNKISCQILELIAHYNDELKYHKLYTKLLRKNIIFKYIPSYFWMQEIIIALDQSKKIHQINRDERSRPSYDKIQLVKN